MPPDLQKQVWLNNAVKDTKYIHSEWFHCIVDKEQGLQGRGANVCCLFAHWPPLYMEVLLLVL